MGLVIYIMRVFINVILFVYYELWLRLSISGKLQLLDSMLEELRKNDLRVLILNIEQCWQKKIQFNSCWSSFIGIYANALETCGMPHALILEKDNFFPYGFINIIKMIYFFEGGKGKMGYSVLHLWFLLYVSDLANNQCLSFKGERKIKNLCY